MGQATAHRPVITVAKNSDTTMNSKISTYFTAFTFTIAQSNWHLDFPRSKEVAKCANSKEVSTCTTTSGQTLPLSSLPGCL